MQECVATNNISLANGMPMEIIRILQKFQFEFKSMRGFLWFQRNSREQRWCGQLFDVSLDDEVMISGSPESAFGNIEMNMKMNF